MRIGQRGDKRKFVDRPMSQHEKDVMHEPSTKPKHCHICGLTITGRPWRVDEDKWACTRCANEQPSV